MKHLTTKQELSATTWRDLEHGVVTHDDICLIASQDSHGVFLTATKDGVTVRGGSPCCTVQRCRQLAQSLNRTNTYNENKN